jgi:hypothetical protein
MKSLKSLVVFVLVATILGTMLLGCGRRGQVRRDTRVEKRTEERMDRRRGN